METCVERVKITDGLARSVGRTFVSTVRKGRGRN